MPSKKKFALPPQLESEDTFQVQYSGVDDLRGDYYTIITTSELGLHGITLYESEIDQFLYSWAVYRGWSKGVKRGS